MKYILIGESQIKISQIGLGTWQFGTKGWGYGSDFDRKTAIELVQKSIEFGINLIDTAEVYGRGESEKIIGEALQGMDREEFVICTKFMPLTLRPSRVVKALHNSLKRLKTDYVDIYLIHWPNPFLPLGRTLRYMEHMVEEGLVSILGVSNFSKKRFIKAQKKMKKYKLEINQLNYNMVMNSVEKTFLPYAKENGIAVMAYSPLAQGWLTGKYSENNRPKGVRRYNRLFRKKNLRRGRALLELLREIAEKYHVTMAQVALNWLIRHENVVAIPGAKNLHQLEDNAKAADFSLSSEDLERINQELEKFKPKIIF